MSNKMSLWCIRLSMTTRMKNKHESRDRTGGTTGLGTSPPVLLTGVLTDSQEWSQYSESVATSYDRYLHLIAWLVYQIFRFVFNILPTPFKNNVNNINNRNKRKENGGGEFTAASTRGCPTQPHKVSSMPRNASVQTPTNLPIQRFPNVFTLSETASASGQGPLSQSNRQGYKFRQKKRNKKNKHLV